MTGRPIEAGFTFVELIMFVVIVSIGVAGILSVFYVTTQKSADPAARKQMIAIAEAMLEEVELMPFTYCDPDDPQAATAISATVGAGGCLVRVEAIGRDTTFSGPGPVVYQPNDETRESTDSAFDNVNDYNGFDTNTGGLGVRDPSGALAGPAGYRAVVSVTAAVLGTGATPIAALDANSAPQSLLINVTVTSPRGESITLSGYRTRYAPASPP